MTIATQTGRSRPRVLQLLATARIGGTERSVMELVKNADTAECDFEVGLLEAYGPLVAQLGALGITVHRWPLRVLTTRPLAFARFIGGFDCVHAYSMRPSLAARFVAWPAHVPVIVGQESIDLFRPSWHFHLERLTSPLVAHYIAKFDAGRKVLVERAGIRPERISVVHNGVDVAPFMADSPGCTELPNGPARPNGQAGTDPAAHPVIISCVANLRPVKRHDRLLHAFAMAVGELDSGDSPAVLLRLIGDGNCRTDLEQLASRLGISRLVGFMGYRDDIAGLLAESDIVILTSDYEGFPLSLIEGMAAGCAVIAPAVGGIPELVVDGQHGLLVRGDDEDYAGAMVRLCRDNGLRRQLGAAARERATTHFTSVKMARQLGDVYRKTIAAWPPTRACRATRVQSLF